MTTPAHLAELVTAQEADYKGLGKFFSSHKKRAGWQTRGKLEARVQQLDKKWKAMQDRHNLIMAKVTKDDKDCPYLKDDFIGNAEDTYYEQVSSFLDAKFELEDKRTTHAGGGGQNQAPSSHRKLPPIALPSFSGKYTEWASFKDKFSSLVVKDESLQPVDRLHYLNACLTGEAKKCIESIPVSDDNYERAWQRLLLHYDNKRAIITSCLNGLFQLSKIPVESFSALKSLRDSTTEAVETLTALKRPVEKWDDLLVYLTVSRFDPTTRRDWETHLGVSAEPITYKEMDDFLLGRIQALERVEQSALSTVSNFQVKKPTNSTNKPSTTQSKVHTLATVKVKSTCCSFCKQSHYIARCDKFRAQSLDQRNSFAVSNRLCFNCLGTHLFRDCRSLGTCGVCRGKHHSLLHGAPPSSSSPATTVNALGPSFSSSNSPNAQGQPTPPGVSTHVAQPSASIPCSTWLATARVNVLLEDGRITVLRALVDPCSGASFIAEAAAQRLNMPRKSAFVPVSGIGATRDRTARSKVAVLLTSQHDKDRRWTAQALVLPCLTDYLPTPRPSSLDLEFVSGLSLADPRPDAQDPIEMILGIDLYTKIIESGLRKNGNEEVIAQQTALGWILSAHSVGLESPTIDSQLPISSFQCIVDTDLSASLQRFWEQEEVSVNPDLLLTHDERECEKHYAATFRRTNEGRYELRLPFKRPLDELGDSYEAARAMLGHMERRFSRDPHFHALYQDFMNEYLALGHMRPELPEEVAEDKVGFYLPHHGVLKASLRTVFNGSVETPSGYPLNKSLYVGKNLLVDTVTVMLRWRMFPIVFSADVVKAFRQIGIAKEDQKFLKILWRRTPSSPVETFRLCTVTYGVVCAPFQTNRTIKQLAEDEAVRFPAASRILKDNIYVDDILAGADTVEEAVSLKEELVDLLLAGGFPLRKWTANDPALLAKVSPEDLAPALSLGWKETNELQMLGISWNPSSDSFSFQFDPQKANNSSTKRGALSIIAQLYDPLGWISPVTIRFKVFMKSLWKNEQKWDDPLPLDLKNKWMNLLSSLNDLHLVSVPRWAGYTRNCQLVEIHGFADASDDAYGAVVYLKTVNHAGTVQSIILTSKSRVSSVKQITIARLELCGALLLVKIVKQVLAALAIENPVCHLWLDSMVALSWIKAQPARWKTYVANRVAEIQSSLPQATWHYVNTLENPADLVSRGTTPRDLSQSSLWFHGPSFICSTADPWPTSEFTPDPTCTEELKVTSHVARVIKAIPEEWDLVHRYSTLKKLLSVTAWCQIFVQKVKKRILLRRQGQQPEPLTRAVTPPDDLVLTPAQIQAGFLLWISHAQQTYFAEELRALSRNLALPRKSPLLRLNPALDALNMLRVRGRLTHSLLEDDEKNPLILPRQAKFASLLVHDAHEKMLHGGTQLTLNFLRQRVWIVRGRQLVKTLISKCLKCWRLRNRPLTQLMGDLPPTRVRPSRPFLHAGVDYAGPINIRFSAGRGAKSYKGYICVFVCFATRAVHLEAASDYSTREFLDVYRRFVGRRGICATLSSDCGTNFVGASRELKKLFLEAGNNDHDIARLLARDGTECKFNPPSAPHFGGLWEAAVKSVKYHLKRVIGDSTLTFEEMSTLLIQIEACLNSRPLCPLDDDASNPSALTPAHFLIGEPLTLVPEPSVLDIADNRLARWQRVRKMLEHFWRRWSSDYLHELQQRSKWCSKRPSVNVGDLCVIRSDQSPPCKWPLARVIEVIEGSDGLARVAKLRTASSTFTRPIVKISIVPLEN